MRNISPLSLMIWEILQLTTVKTIWNLTLQKMVSSLNLESKSENGCCKVSFFSRFSFQGEQ